MHLSCANAVLVMSLVSEPLCQNSQIDIQKCVTVLLKPL